MKALAFGFLVLAVSCQDYNANTFDRDKYGVIELSGSAAFKSSYPILQSRCMSCHRHSQWSEYTNEQDWVNNENLVVAGNANASQLIFRIINHGGASSDMPQGGQPLPTAEYDTLKNWVNGML